MRIVVLSGLLLAAAGLGHSQDTASIQPQGAGFMIDVRIKRVHPALSGSLGVNLVRSTKEVDVIDMHWDVPAESIQTTTASGSTEIRLSLVAPARAIDQTASYILSIPFIPSVTGPATRAEIRMTPLFSGLSAELQSFAGAGDFCPGGVMIVLKGALPDPADWDRIHAFFGARETSPNEDLTIEAGSADSYRPETIRTLVRKTRSLEPVLLGAPYSICFSTLHALPQGAFNMLLHFGTGAPAVLRAFGDIKAKNLDGSQSPAMANASAPPGAVGTRTFERNLDMGLAYTQSRNLKTGAIDRFGVIDIRLAPLLDVHRRIGQQSLNPQTIPSWWWFLTPLSLDANVATGHIVGSTVALNRISFGSQAEFRYMRLRPKRGGKFTLPRYPNVHRFTVAFNHNSDRDFKQREYVAQLQYQPLIGILNEPRKTRYIYVDDKVMGGQVESLPKLGWLVQPRFGLELGDTYYRSRPAAAITPSAFVRRGYAGLDLALEVTGRFALTLSDSLYTRGEIGPEHLVNYLKLEADFLIGSPVRETNQSLFLTYERGSLPPFDKLNANALRLGYRLRSENWFGFLR